MTESIFKILTFENPVFNAFSFWSAILVLKMLAMSLLTALQRFRTQTFANPEDLPSKKLKVKYDDPDVERIRRAHRNDMENIYTFFVAGFLYVWTNPSPFLAINLFRVVAISRIIHTLVYAVFVVPQPARALAFFVCYGATVYMAVHVILICLKF